MGGGVLIDVVGFVASCFRRGVPHVRVPTNLMGYIDAAIGIKTISTEALHGLWYAVMGWFLHGWILPLTFSITFSFLWILGNCWNCQQLRKVLSFAGAILLSLNLNFFFLNDH